MHPRKLVKHFGMSKSTLFFLDVGDLIEAAENL